MENGKTGFLVQNLEEMIQDLWKSIDEIDREKIRLYVERNFSAEVMAENYNHIYERVIARCKETSGRQQKHF